MILNFVELHLDDVLEVLLVGGVEFLTINTKGRFTEKIMMIEL